MNTRSRKGATMLEVLISAGMMVPILAIGVSLLVMAARALATGAVRSGAVRGVVVLREELLRDLADRDPATPPLIGDHRITLKVVQPDGVHQVIYQGTDKGQIFKIVDGQVVRVGRLMRGVFNPADEGDGKLSVNLVPRDETGERDVGVAAYEETFGGHAQSRYDEVFQPVL